MQHGRAVVIGGSMAGLVTARVLSDHFEEVVVVERDPIPDTLVEARKGVPQGRHLHALLARGGQLLEQLFPGLRAGAIAEGALLLDWGRDMAWHHFGGWKARHDSGIELLCSSRPFLESQVRRRLFERANVRRLDRHDVLALRSSTDRRRVTGVELRRREGDEGEAQGGGESLAAELVVDAGGRGSKTLAWLEALGHAQPPESSVRVQVGYSSRVFDLPEPERFDWRGAYVVGGPAERHRIGAIFPIEDKRAIVVLAGLLGDYPPDDDEGFARFADTLPGATIGPVVRALPPVSPIATHRFPAHRRRHFERVPPPDGLVVIGDALVSFNPIYGQGMTTAALAAELLGQCLATQRERAPTDVIAGFSRRFHVAAGKLADVPWLLSTSEDFRNPAIEGARPPGYAALRWYTERVHRAARVDPFVHGKFLRVMHMLAGPESLFDPRVAWRALVGARRAPTPQPKPRMAPA